MNQSQSKSDDQKPDFTLGYEINQFQIYLYQIMHNFRKEHKYTLGKSISEKSWLLSDLVYQANGSRNPKRITYMNEANIVFNQLKSRINFAYDIKLISHKQLGHLLKYCTEISKMLSGWKKWAQKQSS